LEKQKGSRDCRPQTFPRRLAILEEEGILDDVIVYPMKTLKNNAKV
jgi:hypothetical protein